MSSRIEASQMHSIVLLALGIASILARFRTSVKVLIPHSVVNEYCHSVRSRPPIPNSKPAAIAIISEFSRSGRVVSDHLEFDLLHVRPSATSLMWPPARSRTDSATLPMRRGPVHVKIESFPRPIEMWLGTDRTRDQRERSRGLARAT